MNIVENLRRWVRPEDGYYDEDEDMTSAWARTAGSEFGRRETARKEVSIRTTTQLKVAITQPRGLDEVRGISDEIKDMMTVVLNVEQLDRDLSRRVLDVLSGVAYGLDASIFRVARPTYIILPFNVEVEAGLMSELASNGLLGGQAGF